MERRQRYEERARAVARAVDEIRAIEQASGVNRESLERIKQVLQTLAARHDLFEVADFPPLDGVERNNALYRLSEDDDHRFALYAQISRGDTHTPAHDHTTWAVIVGIEGQELNRLYEKAEVGGVRERRQVTIGPGDGIAFMPDDLHSIHIEGGGPVLNFHMYGLALEQLHGRRYYDRSNDSWKHFPASSGIRPAPAP
ncbi:MAG: cysteine dioxygenase [Burkholderiaceae bacterium]